MFSHLQTRFNAFLSPFFCPSRCLFLASCVIKVRFEIPAHGFSTRDSGLLLVSRVETPPDHIGSWSIMSPSPEGGGFLGLKSEFKVVEVLLLWIPTAQRKHESFEKLTF